MWKIDITDSARKELKRLSKPVALQIIKRIRKRLADQDDPTTYAKPLQRELFGLWRLRVENYRIIFRVRERNNTIEVTRVAHRSNVYRQ